MSQYFVTRVDSPTDEQVEDMTTLAASLMYSDPALLSLTGGRADLLPQLMGLNLRAARVGGGDFFLAQHADETFAGYAMCMGPGKKLYSTEEQRNEGLAEYLAALGDEGRKYFGTVAATEVTPRSSTFNVEFLGFLSELLGPSGQQDGVWVHYVMVQPAHQRKGIARMLLDAVRAHYPDVRINLSTTTAANEAIYNRLQYKTIGRKTVPSPWGDWPLFVLSNREQ